MSSKVIFLAIIAVVCAAPATEWPAGVSPALCPDYPNCNNEILHNNGVPIVRYDVSSLPVGPALPAEYYPYIPHQYPDGVSAAACPNYPFCNNREIVLPLPGFKERLYPAGVSPALCPNYPNC